ncbi:Protein rai1 [Coniochaeta pulveracea]|uniref:Decapping nuclease n=1 Tax=Coniochaeta pulveracea TaxID=177199 RepID=A0A420YAL6_9PEZI|nr:Protein rai1 [Coniochaeta pulveracea]
MANTFSVHPVGRFAGPSQPLKRPREFACFSYDKDHRYHYDDSSMKWYYPPQLGADLSKGYETFQKHDNSQDEHIDSLLETIMRHEKETGQAIDAKFVTWRGMMTKIMAAPFDDRDGFEMNATLYRDCIFIEENWAYKAAQEQQQKNWKGPIPSEVMQYWGYKFETLSTLPAPWGEVSREYIEGRDDEIVNNKEQYCSVVRTGIGKNVICLGGEVDCIWDAKPQEKGKPINWVELKTSAEIKSDRDMENFDRKMMKFWIQSFLLGVPKIIVGFRSKDGILQRLENISTAKIPDIASRKPRPLWDGNICINFANGFLDWLRTAVDDEGVYRIRRKPRSPEIEVWKVEETGHGKILTDDFINWRIKLAMGPPPETETE